MGLAAAQARFLGITMRKASCEYRSTELAQQKLEITNQLAAIAQDYSNSMNATKLVWSNDAFGSDINLTYSLLMMPSVANDYNPYMITTTSGAIVLNSEYAAAAKAAGISMAGGAATKEGREKFIEILTQGGLITEETRKGINNVNWNALAGLGAAPKDKNPSNVMTLSDMIIDKTIGGKTAGLTSDITQEELKDKYNINTGTDKVKHNNLITVIRNGTVEDDSSYINNLTIADLLTGEVVIMRSKSTDSEKAEDGKTLKYTSFADEAKNIFTHIAEAFGYNKPLGTGLYIDDASNDAINAAYTMVVNKYLNSRTAIDSGNKGGEKVPTELSAYNNAISYNRIGTDTAGDYYAVSLTGLVSAFLTYYDNELRGSESPFFVGASIETSNLITDTPDYEFIIGQDESELIPTNEKIADFYDMIYNNICAHGWRQDSSLDDNEYFESSIKNGRYSITSLNNDGYFYQTRYNETGYLVEETDRDAITHAEAEYTRKKSELTYKEDFIDLKSKNLDAEIAELGAEMDSVKNIISKSIEKTFSMYQQ